MKLLHLSDLHLGKQVHECSMLEEQAAILEQILAIVREEQPSGVLIAGDVYDKSVPPVEAVALFDRFLVKLSALGVLVCVISGNHDSAERMAFGARLMLGSGVYVAPAYHGAVQSMTLRDDFGRVVVWMLPFVKPAHVRRFFPEKTIESYTDALQTVIDHMQLDPDARHVLITHQFVTGAMRCESEELSVGGTDQVDAAVFAPFDYVALGHLHSPQKVGRETVRYSGTPLKYSFSEMHHQKSVTIVELGEKGTVHVRQIALTPLHDLREIRGSYLEITAKSFYEGTATEDYLRIVLTDETDIPDAIGKLRVIYPNILQLTYDNQRTRAGGTLGDLTQTPQQTPMGLFETFYETQNGQAMSDEQHAFLAGLMEQIWEGDA